MYYPEDCQTDLWLFSSYVLINLCFFSVLNAHYCNSIKESKVLQNRTVKQR